jgi:hypothetical protein
VDWGKLARETGSNHDKDKDACAQRDGDRFL